MSFSSTFDIKFSIVSGTVLTDSNGTAAITIMVGATAGAATITASISDSAGTAITNDTGITVNLQAPPAVPTALTATGASQSQIDLAWLAGAGAAPAGYKIYKGGSLLKSVTTTTSTDMGLTASTQYCYAVSSYDLTGSESARTTQVCATTTPPPPPIPPPVPTGLSATAASQSQVDLSWTASSGAASYKISRGGADLSTTSATVYSDTGLAANTSFCYSVAAVDSSGNASAQSGQLCVTTLTVPPQVPTGLAATTASTSQINLIWTASVGLPAAAGYKVYRSGTFVKPVTTTNTSDTSLQPGKQYCYQVTAYDATGSESARSLQSCAATTALPAPDNFAITAASYSQINLSWMDLAVALGYKIYKGGTILKPVPGSPASDTGLAASTQYCYTVSAYDSAGNESIQTSQLCAMTLTPPPAVPAGVTARVTAQNVGAGTATVSLSWTASDSASEYYIYRDGNKIVTAVPITGTSYPDTAATIDASHTYTVAAVDATGSASSQSSQLSVYTGLTVPALVSLMADSSTQITFTWSGGGTKKTGYKVYRTGASTRAMTATETSLVDGGLTANTQYCYSVSATDDSGKESAQTSQLCATTPSPPTPAAIDLLVSSQQLNSDGAGTVTLTALVKDGNNLAMSGQIVAFSSTSTLDPGIITVTQGTTDASGQAIATLGTGGKKSYRTITVKAKAGSEEAINTVDVVGTTLTISGQDSVVLDKEAEYTIMMKDSAGNAISGKSVTLSSLHNTFTTPSGNPVTATTDMSGQIKVTFKATDTSDPGRSDTLTAESSVMGLTGAKVGAKAVLVVPTYFVFNKPAAGAVISVNTPTDVQVEYKQGGVAVPNGTFVYFSTSRGTFTTAYKVGTIGGLADIKIKSTTVGPATITAFVENGPSAQQSVEFVSTTPSTMNLQADPTVIGTNTGGATTQRSAIVAVLRDSENNFVKDKTVNFTVTADHSVGYLSPATAKTDSAGMASVLFIGGSAPSETGGVTIQALEPISGITATTTLTVAQKALNVIIGTGKLTVILSPTTYQKDFTALVTDGAGNPMKDAVVTAKLTPIAYYKGYTGNAGTSWGWRYTLTSTYNPRNYPYTDSMDYCLNEDLTWYGVKPSYVGDNSLEAGEDFNNNGILDPRNIAAVTPEATTDANGLGTLSVIYPKNYATWVTVRLEVTALMAGTEGMAYTVFTLPLVVSDYSYPSVSPPNSPFGMSSSCADVVETPTLLVATAASDTLVNLSWSPSTGAAGYKIYKGGVFLKLSSTSATTDTAVAANTEYSYTVSAVDGAGNESAQTTAVYVTTPPTKPTFTINPALITDTTVTLSMTNSAGANMCNVYRDGVLLATVPVAGGATKAWTDGQAPLAALTPNTAYCYAIDAENSSGAKSVLTTQQCYATTP